jgi:aspartate kinase
MGIVVQKFGGSSVESTEKLFNVCKHITKEYDNNNKVIVVVSAQGKTTDNLIKQAKEIDKNLLSKRELDVLLSVGEQITIAKLAMCLNKLGYDSISLTGWQVPIKTNNIYGNANILKINLNRIIAELNRNKIVVVAGFQGINEQTNDITTLGRGGSDTTAVAIAAAIKANKCDIYKDVDGVYNLDPKTNKNTYKYDKISYDKMLELSNNGAKILHNKCIELAKKYNVPIHVKSLYNKQSIGTKIC